MKNHSKTRDFPSDEMPFHLAVLNKNGAAKVREEIPGEAQRKETVSYILNFLYETGGLEGAGDILRPAVSFEYTGIFHEDYPEYEVNGETALEEDYRRVEERYQEIELPKSNNW